MPTKKTADKKIKPAAKKATAKAPAKAAAKAPAKTKAATVKAPVKAKAAAAKAPPKAKAAAAKAPAKAKAAAAKTPTKAKAVAAKAKAATAKTPEKGKVANLKTPEKIKTAAAKVPAKAKAVAELPPLEVKAVAAKAPKKSKSKKAPAKTKGLAAKMPVKTIVREVVAKTASNTARAVGQIQKFDDFKPYKPSRAESYMNGGQLEHFRELLLSWRLELVEEMTRTVSHMKDEASNFPDPADRATQEEEFSLELRTRDRERKLIKKIDSTLERISIDDYGYCDACGIEIGFQRLEVRPTATLCIDCKTLAEIKERQELG